MSQENEITVAKVLVACAVTVVIGPPLTFAVMAADAFVVSTLWGWHFAALAGFQLTFTQAMIAALCVRALSVRHMSINKATRSKVELMGQAIVWLAFPWIALAIGWAVL